MHVRSPLSVVVALACVGGLVAPLPEALAQTPQPTVLNNAFQSENLSEAEQKRKISAMRLDKNRVLQGSVGWDAAAQDTLKRWLNSYVFPTMTQPAYFGDLADFRKGVRDDLRMIKPERRQYYLDQVMAGAGVLLQPQYAIETRLNAALLLGELNIVERTVQDKAPTPYPAALPVLRALVADQQPEAVQAAALNGILRHVESQWVAGHARIAESERNALIGAMLQLATSAEPPASRSPETHAWLRSRAVDVLAGINITGPRGEVYQVFRDILQEKDAPLTLRAAAAVGLGRLPYGQMTLDAEPAVIGLTRLVVDSCDLEVKRLEGLKRSEELKRLRQQGPSSIGGAGSGGGGPSGGAPGAPSVTGSGGAGAAVGGLPPNASRGMGAGGGRRSSPPGASGKGGPAGGGPRSGGGATMGGGGTMGGGLFGGGGGMYGGMGGDAGEGKIGDLDDYLVEGSRRRLRYHLYCAQKSLNGVNSERRGIKPLVQGDAATQANEVGLVVADLLKETKDTPTDLDALIRTLKRKADQLRLSLPVDAAPVPPSDEGPPALSAAAPPTRPPAQ